MPFIDSKITGNVSKEKREAIKSKLGQAVSILHKSETFLMVGFEDQYDLYMGGNSLEQGAYVSVSLFGDASSADYEKMTGAICKIMRKNSEFRETIFMLPIMGFMIGDGMEVISRVKF